jgi:hypothetical protein
MVEHDFRYNLLSPQHTLIECRSLAPGRYQVTGNGGSIQHGDVLIVTLKGSKDLSMRLTVEKVRHLINPARPVGGRGQGPGVRRAVDSRVAGQLRRLRQRTEVRVRGRRQVGTKEPQKPAASARIAELGWRTEGSKHLCPNASKRPRHESRLTLMALLGASLDGLRRVTRSIASRTTATCVEWIGERPLMDYSHLTVTLGTMAGPMAMAAATTGSRRTRLDGDKLTFGGVGSTRKAARRSADGAGAALLQGPANRGALGHLAH